MVDVSSDRDSVAAFLMRQRIIIAALSSGVVVFAGIVIVQPGAAQPGAAAPEAAPPGGMFGLGVLSVVGLAAALAAVPAALVIPRLLAARQLTMVLAGKLESPQLPTEIDQLLAVRTTGMIVAAVLFEGPGFLNLVAYMMERQAISLAAAGGMLVGIAAQFPWRPSLDAWIADQQRWLADERSLSQHLP